MHATRILTDQIRMLQELRKLSSRPHFMDAVKLLTDQEANGAAPAHSNGNTPPQHGGVVETGITQAVVATFSKTQGEFTYQDVLRQLEQDGYIIQAKNKRDAVGRVLRNVAKKGKRIEELRRGTGGSPTVYRRVER